MPMHPNKTKKPDLVDLGAAVVAGVGHHRQQRLHIARARDHALDPHEPADVEGAHLLFWGCTVVFSVREVV